jgi:hypothetical protein
MVEFMVPAHNENPNIYFEVFVHKAEKLPEEDKIGEPFIVVIVLFVSDLIYFYAPCREF